MTLAVVIVCLALAAISLALMWHFSRGWRYRRAYQRAYQWAWRSRFVDRAVGFWDWELRKATLDLRLIGIQERFRATILFEDSLRHLLATAIASGSEELYEDIGLPCERSSFLRSAAKEAGIDIDKFLSPSLRMRIRDDRIKVSESGGIFWRRTW